MSNEKPEALELADIFENLSHQTGTRRRAATELLRLHAKVQVLEAMLESIGAGGVSAQRVRQESDYITQPRKMVAAQEPFGYFKAEPFGWRDCAETDEGAIALYEAPQPQADARDAECFRFWVSEAARSPAAMAKLIMHCTTEDEYRAAITQCIDARKAAIAAAKENK